MISWDAHRTLMEGVLTTAVASWRTLAAEYDTVPLARRLFGEPDFVPVEGLVVGSHCVLWSDGAEAVQCSVQSEGQWIDLW